VHNEGVRRAVLAALLASLIAVPAAAARTDSPAQVAPPPPAIAWRHSTPVGLWWAGRLRDGVQLPAEGLDWFTWDPVLKVTPDRPWRRWGTDRLVRTVIDVITAYRLAHPGVARIGVGDLSRRHGGEFGRRFGGLGHASHQNGLDADVYYPRLDRLERRAYKPTQVDQVLAQDLLDGFLAAGARVVYVGPRLDLVGPRTRVVPLVHHDDHMHVRLQLRG
jgi:murein endopeptidase